MHSKSLLSGYFLKNFILGKKRTAAYLHNFCAMLPLFCIALVFSITLTNKARASEHQGTANYENIDNRWLPWIGSWHLVSNKVNTGENTPKEEYLLTIQSGNNSNSIAMKGKQDDKNS